MEGEDLKLCLYDCLKAAGLQHYYARLTSVGVRCAAHLSRVTMEDYPILGICSMEDRTRLFQLVQVVKTLDLESEDDDYDTGCGEEGYAEAESSITYDGRGDPDEDVYDDEDETGAAVSELKADSFSRASRVHKRLDFSCESIDHHEKLSSHPVGTVVSTDCYAYASHDRDNDPCQDRGPTTPVHLGVDTGSTVVWTCEGINNHKPDAHSHQYDHHKRANTKPDFVNRNSMYNFHTRLSPKCVSAHIPKPKPETVVSKRFSNILVGHKDGKGISRKEKLSAEIISNGASVTTMPVYQAKRAAGYNYGLPLSSPPTPNKRQPRGQRINVCVRKRPLTRTECMRGEADVVTTSSGECVIVHESKEAVDLRQYTLQHRFYFDQVFGEESSNEEVYQRTAYPLVQHMLNGGKATCFAYGQTGAGKTHTMLGSSPRRPGLYALAARDIFAHLSTTHTHSPLLVFVSFFEIYCGQLYDLLDHRKRLFAREDGQKVVHIAGLRIVRVDSVSSLLEVISQGTEERTQGTSGVNPLSSRSHALLQIQLRGTNQQIAGKLWFVDLAGSERASDTKDPDKQSRVEGAEINQSLLALKECIRSLDQEQSHTPFRQSKLTQILKDSFVGDSMTCMIANISPGHFTTEHTLNTLRYADRVKELRRQDGLRGGRRGKTIPSPKHNLLNCSSGGSRVCTRGKSPPKKAKLGKQREAFSPTAPTSRLTTGGTILCSTAKNSRWKEETRARKRIGLEQITPIRGLLGIGDKRERKERAGQGKDRRRETYGGNDSADHPICDQNIGAGLVLGQSTENQLHLRGIQRKSVLYHREKENQQSNLKGGREGESRWIEQRRQLENSEDTCSEVERLRETDLQKVDERDKERERHLKWYHQQLQQFMPSPASSSDQPFFTSTCPSFSPSNQAFFSSSVSESSVQHSSHISVSTLMHHDLEKVLDGYRAKVEVRTDGNNGQLSSFPRGEISLQTETSPRYNKNTFEVGCGDSGGISEDWSVSLEGTEAGFEQDSGKSEKMRSLRATGEREVRVRREDWGPVGRERRGERKLAFMTETEQTNRMKGTRPADEFHSCDSEMDKKGCLDASNVQPDAVWSTEEQEGTDGYSLVSTYSNNDRNSIFNHPPVKSPHQRAPAERPLSPVFTHTNTFVTHNKLGNLSLKLKNTRLTSNILPLPLENPQQGVSSSSFKEKEPLFAANTNRREFANAHLASQPLSTPITKNGCEILVESLNILSENPDYTQVHNHPEAKDNMLVLAQGETSTDSLGYIIDPLSISLLEVDQQVATASFLQGEHGDSSLCLLEMGECKRKELDKDHRKCSEIAGKAIEDEDVEFCLSLLELPQAVATHCPSTPGTMIAANHSEGKKRACFATDERYGIGMMKPLIPEVMLVSLQNQENNQKPKTTPAIEDVDNKAPASPLKPSTCTSTGACAMQSISSSVQHTGSHSSQNLMRNSATQVPPNVHNVHNKFAFSISNPQSESVLNQLNTKRCHTVHSNHSSNSDISIQPNSPAQSDLGKSTSSLQIRPIIHLSTLEDFYHDQWRVVQAHWEQLEEMETLCRKEGTLLWRQPDMAFEEYVCTLGEIMERQACCVHRMIAQLQPYLQTSHSNQPHNQGKDNHDQMI